MATALGTVRGLGEPLLPSGHGHPRSSTAKRSLQQALPSAAVWRKELSLTSPGCSGSGQHHACRCELGNHDQVKGRASGRLRGFPASSDALLEGSSHHQSTDGGEEEKSAKLRAAIERLQEEQKRRSVKLREQARKAALDSELKFGKQLVAEGRHEQALAHFTKVAAQSPRESYQYGDAMLQKAQCLEKAGQEGEAREVYGQLATQLRSPFPSIKRRAARALWGSAAPPGAGGNPSLLEDAFFNMFAAGFGSYAPKDGDKRVETPEEKQILQIVPWAILAVGPILMFWMLVVAPK